MSFYNDCQGESILISYPKRPRFHEYTNKSAWTNNTYYIFTAYHLNIAFRFILYSALYSMDCSCNIKTVKLPNVEPYVKEYVKVLLTRLICKVKQNWPWYKKTGFLSNLSCQRDLLSRYCPIATIILCSNPKNSLKVNSVWKFCGPDWGC